jgi:hypothetical protein
MHINALAALRPDPSVRPAFAGKYQRMHAVTVDHGEFQIAPDRGG